MNGNKHFAPTNYLYDGPNLIEELDNSENVLARYSQDSGIDSPVAMLRGGVTPYCEQDGIGAVTSLSNSGAGGPAFELPKLPLLWVPRPSRTLRRAGIAIADSIGS